VDSTTRDLVTRYESAGDAESLVELALSIWDADLLTTAEVLATAVRLDPGNKTMAQFRLNSVLRRIAREGA
jgi:hypothetical protein